VTIIVRHVIGKLDAAASRLCHDPHFNGRSTCGKPVAVHRQPMSLGKVGEHRRIATSGNDAPGRRIRLKPVLLKVFVPRHAMHAILSIQHVVRPTPRIEDRRRGRQLLEATSGFLATRAVAGGGEYRPSNRLQLNLAASAYRVASLFPVHGDRLGEACLQMYCGASKNVFSAARGDTPTVQGMQQLAPQPILARGERCRRRGGWFLF
jgi:hypothetical protein